MSCTRSHAAKCGLELSNRSSIPSRTRDDTFSNCAWSTQCRAAYSTRGNPLEPLLPACSSSWRSVPRHACARIVCAGLRSIRNHETSPCDRARRGDVRYSVTEKCENCTTRDSPLGTMAIKLEHVE